MFDNVEATVGSTPLVRLNRVAQGLGASVALKLESRNPGGSIKDRVALGMIDDAEKRGLIERGRSVIVEPTSGNTGVAIAMVCAERGYRAVLTMPENMSLERRRLLAAFGAEVVLTPAVDGMLGAVDAAERIADETEGGFLTRQFDNPANPASHYATTAPEIDDALGGKTLGAFVAGVGTGGTITGVGRYLREHRPGALVVALEPAESPIISQAMAGETIVPAAHGIQGIGANFVPG
ncbi:MAG: pyridoxal-phosphate dependent enzyme, partial [Coriobacteriia bacterium]|nr:pyridoxal-phosphate dependent enzyme [Coriobacteriia bacterium]